MLSIDGVHLENDLGLHLLAGSDETMMPETRQDTLTIPDRHGAIVFDSYLEPRRLFPQILIPSQATLNDVQGIVRKVSSLLVDEYGKPKDVKLIYDYEPEKYYIARLTGYISVDRIAKAGIFLIPMYAYDPFAYSISTAYDEIKEYNSGDTYEGVGTLYPNPVHIDLKFNKQSSSVYNHSSIETPLNLKVRGYVKSLKITNLTTGQTLKIDTTVNKGDVLEINGSGAVIKLNGIDIMKTKKGDYITLIPGRNDLSFTSVSPDGTIEYMWEHKFV
jgi:predicted phage tail component-like protein